MDITFLNKIKLEHLYILLLIFIIFTKSPQIHTIIYLVSIVSTYTYNKLLSYMLLIFYLIIIYYPKRKIYKNKKIKEYFNSNKKIKEYFNSNKKINAEEEFDIKDIIKQIFNISESESKSLITNNNIINIEDLLVIEKQFSILQKKRLNGFNKKRKIFLFYDDITIKLLDDLIYEVRDVSSVKYILNNKQKFSLEYYVLEKKPLNEYVDLLKELDLYKYYDTIDTNSNENTFRDMMEIMILFDYYDLIGLRTEPKLNLNVRLGVNGWIYRCLKRIKDNNWQDLVFKRYNILDRSNELSNKIKLNYREIIDINANQMDFSKLDDEKEPQEYSKTIKKYQDILKNKEYKTLEFLNDYSNSNEVNENLTIKLFENFGTHFSSTLMETINDLVNLKSENYENYSEQLQPLDKYIILFKKIVNILLKDGRMFYLGFLFLIISLTIYFAEITM